MEFLDNVAKFAEYAACITGFVFLYKLRKSYWKYFPIYLLFIVIAEGVGFYTRQRNLSDFNQHFYNYFEIPAEYLFFFWIFSKAFKSDKLNWLPLTCSVIYIAAWLTDVFYFSGLKFWFYSFSVSIGNLSLLVLALRYFIRLVNSDDILNFNRDILFWVSTGILLFYLGTFPYYGLRITLATKFPKIYLTYSYVVTFLDASMYIMFSLGFIWGRPNSASLSS